MGTMVFIIVLISLVNIALSIGLQLALQHNEDSIHIHVGNVVALVWVTFIAGLCLYVLR